MTMDHGHGPLVADLFKAAVAIAAGVIGRLMYHAREVQALRRPPFSWHLVWELPVAIGMGLVAAGAADHFDLARLPTIALIVGISYLGPPVVEWMFVAARKRVEGAKP